MALNDTEALQTQIEGSVENFLNRQGQEPGASFEIEVAQIPTLLIRLYNALTQAVLEWGKIGNKPVNGFSYLDKRQILEPGGCILPEEKWLEERIAGFLGFKNGKAYRPSQVSIRTYHPEADRAHLEIAGAAIGLTRSQVIQGRPPLINISNYTLAVRPPRGGGEGVWSLKLSENHSSERDRLSAEARQATASRRGSIELATALEREGLKHPYAGGAVEMAGLSKRVKRF